MYLQGVSGSNIRTFAASLCPVASLQLPLQFNFPKGNYFILFYWKIIVLQYCVSFCHISTWISHRYTHVPSRLNPLPLPSPSHPSRLSQSTGLNSYCYRANSTFLSILRMIMYVSILFSQFVPPSPSSTVSTSLFSVSVVSIAAPQVGSSVPSL